MKLDEDQVRRIVGDLVRSGIDAIAILFLHSYRNPVHEQRVKQIVQEMHPGLFVSASHELSQEYREFERSSTVAANAYVGPRVRDYLSVMNDASAARRISTARSSSCNRAAGCSTSTKRATPAFACWNPAPPRA